MDSKNKFIVVKNSKIHGRGVFASQDIKKGTQIIQYIGRKVTKKESDEIFYETLEKSKKDPLKGEIYLFELNNKYDIDGNISKNFAKYINHSCEPNCETEIIEDKEIWISAIKNIKEGEELSFNYGFDISVCEEHPCKCGTKSCIGFILDKDYWPKLNK